MFNLIAFGMAGMVAAIMCIGLSRMSMKHSMTDDTSVGQDLAGLAGGCLFGFIALILILLSAACWVLALNLYCRGGS